MAGLACGIVGLPNVGKSTLFNAITKAGAEAANYPFCTIEPNVGVVPVRDRRIDRLAEIEPPDKVIYATMEFVDIAGLVRGASKGEGRGNQFLDNIAHVDEILHVVRCFDDPNVVHVDGKVNPVSDIETINLELILADLQKVENAIPRLERRLKSNDKAAAAALPVLKLMEAHLGDGKPLRTIELTDDQWRAAKEYKFITTKTMIYAANVSEDDLPEMENDYVQAVRDFAAADGAEVVAICAKMEEEISQLDAKDARDFLSDMGLDESGLDRLVKTSFHSLGLITYLTSGKLEARAWTIRRGTKAPQAAAVIHTDFEKGFIRAEVTPFAAVDAHNGKKGAQEAGLLRVEGKDYVVQDGDVINFRIGN